MTLRRTMAYQIGGMIVALLLLSGAALWGLNGLRHDYDSALQGYQDLRSLYEVASHVAVARAALDRPQPDEPAARRELQRAAERFELYVQRRSAMPPATRPTFTLPQGDPEAQEAALNLVYRDIASLVADLRMSIEDSQRAADAKRRTTMLAMAILSGALVVLAIGIGVAQYRSVATPLAHLSAGVRRIAAARFADRVEPQGHAEFVALAQEFNAMARELDELYRELERKVEQKSRELVRSERLASVGYLAAGVAHEINNPLGIITGYAEMCLRQLERQYPEGGEAPPGAFAETIHTLRVVCQEAFRCKQITGKLLSLASRSDEERRIINLAEVARHVVSLVAGLPAYRDRKVTLQVDETAPTTVYASESEMQQVLLNLTLNALEAVEPRAGQVTIEVARRENVVEMTVTDNGRGMTPEILERIFEPFFTARRAEGRGTGLGLSITHAIVQDHGGSIAAHSDGPGRGARLVVRLPVATVQAEDAAATR